VVVVLVPRGTRRFEVLEVRADHQRAESASVTSRARASTPGPARRRIALASPG
jgi:hypothetical protein